MPAATRTRKWSGTPALLSALMALGGLAFVIVDGRVEADVGPGSAAEAAVVAAAGIILSGLGWLLTSRLPRNAIGWLLMLGGGAFALTLLMTGYAVHALLVDPGSLPGGVWAAWVGGPVAVPIIWVSIVFIPLLFPDGRLPSKRWRSVAWMAGGGIALMFLGALLDPEGLGIPGAKNPTGIESAASIPWGVSWLFMLVAMILEATSLIFRFRRAEGVERQQLKWVAFSGAIAAAGGLAGLVSLAAHGPDWLGLLAGPLLVVGLGSIPITISIAILRHRLYDIDLVINKTLVYGVLTAALGAGYFGLVVVLQQLTRPFTEGSDLAIAASTLVVAALFRPARGRVQALVDRRFYRRKYDSIRTLETFSARLRQEIDLQTLTGELGSVVDHAMQPAQVSLWVRGEVSP